MHTLKAALMFHRGGWDAKEGRGATGVHDNIADDGGKIVAASDDCTVSAVHAAS
jgi:hypothetical protein